MIWDYLNYKYLLNNLIMCFYGSAVKRLLPGWTPSEGATMAALAQKIAPDSAVAADVDLMVAESASWVCRSAVPVAATGSPGGGDGCVGAAVRGHVAGSWMSRLSED